MTSLSTLPPPPTTHLLPSPFTNTTPPPALLAQGAEALVYKTHFLDSETPAILKFRPSKAYRHPTLDARLTKQRVLAEARVLVKLASLAGVSEVRVPGVLALEWDVGRRVKGAGGRDVRRVRKEEGLDGQREDHGDGEQKETTAGAWILMEWIDGVSVKELLRGVDAWVKSLGEQITDGQRQDVEEEVKALLRRIGRAVGHMHSKGGVIHGDLTSSNIMVRPHQSEGQDGQREAVGARCPSLRGEIVLIDFGLATQAIQDEDRAVDLYVLERAFGSTHPKQEGLFDAEVLQHPQGYRGSFTGSTVALKRLDEVRLRGRKRSMIG